MSETTRRVFVGLTAATDEPAHHVMAGVLDAVRNALPGLAIETTSSHVLDEDDEPELSACLVFRDGALYSVHVDDPEGAEGRALEVQGVVVEVPVVVDYRPKEAR
jgi:hypothetical protein